MIISPYTGRKTYELKDLKIGQKVKVSTWDGGYNIGIIESIEKNIKNDSPGIDYITETGESYWCYLEQIKSIL